MPTLITAPDGRGEPMPGSAVIYSPPVADDALRRLLPTAPTVALLQVVKDGLDMRKAV
jgi:hypothetical protein